MRRSSEQADPSCLHVGEPDRMPYATSRTVWPFRASPSRSARLRTAAAVASGVVALGLLVAAPQLAHADPQFPSWAEVQAAQNSAAAKQAEIAKLTGLIAQLETTSAQLGAAAVQANEAYLQAEADLQTATDRSRTLSDAAARATAKATASRKQAGTLIAQMARTGGGDLSAALAVSTASSADKILYRLGAMSRVSATSSDILKQAEYDQKSAAALGAQATAAEAERATRAAAAADALTTAQAAQSAAQQQVDSTKAQSDTAYAQLASLNQQSVSLNQQYLQGVAYRAEQARVAAEAAAKAKADALAAARAKAPSAGSVSPASSGGTPISSTAGAPNTGAVAQAIAFARAQLGDPYAFGGAGPNSWDCSGLTMAAYASAGVSIGGHGATLQFNYLRAVGRLVPFSQIQPGDLVFYSYSGSSSGIEDHVAIYLGGGQIIEAPRPGVPVRVWPMYSAGRLDYVGRPTG